MSKDELERELRREIELNKEKDHLVDVINDINKEIIELVDKRKEVVEFILKYREKNLEEYRDDEDKGIEYFNHELYVKEEQFKLIEKRLRELTILISSPYFGKVDFEDKYGRMNIYIGRFGVTTGDYEPLIVDWRSPVSSLFYQGKLGDSSYTAPEGCEAADIISKRQFIIKNRRLEGMFDSSLNVKDDILQFVLSRNTDDKLKDVVMTIQKEQDNIIRQPRKGAMVVDGIAGSGKTTIALHRVAYLLYNYRKELQDKVLVLGPNSIFIDYISMVLPSLGEGGVKQSTFRQFASEVISEIEDTMDFKSYMERLLDDKISLKSEVKYKRSPEYIKDMDSVVEKVEKIYLNARDIKLYDSLIVSKSEIQDMIFVDFKAMPLFKRVDRTWRIICSRVNEERNRRVGKIQKDYEEMLSQMSENQMNDRAADLEFKRNTSIRKVISDVMLTKRKALEWIRKPDVTCIYNEYNENKEIIYEDLPAILYLKIKLEGLRYSSDIKHIVIDEAQDYSMLQFKVIRELTGCSSFTIVGDVNQRIMPTDEACAMLNIQRIFEDMDVKYFSLKTGYRSTREIMEYASKYLREDDVTGVRKGDEVQEYKAEDIEFLLKGILKNIGEFKEDGYESIAIVCKTLKESRVIYKAISEKIHVSLFDSEDIVYSKGDVILPSYFAKGLEFDAVLMIDSFEDSSDDSSRLKYIMSTRALHKLCVYKISFEL